MLTLFVPLAGTSYSTPDVQTAAKDLSDAFGCRITWEPVLDVPGGRVEFFRYHDVQGSAPIAHMVGPDGLAAWVIRQGILSLLTDPS